jgi:hypothetical protein
MNRLAKPGPAMATGSGATRSWATGTWAIGADAAGHRVAAEIPASTEAAGVPHPASIYEARP